MDIGDKLEGAEFLNLEPDSVHISRLCIYSDNIDIPHITEILKCTPTKAHQRGEIRPRISMPARIGLWYLEAPENLKLPEQIQFLVSATNSDVNVWDELSSTHRIELRCAIFLHCWTGGFDIPVELMAEISHRHWQFGLSTYSAESDEILDAFIKPQDKPQ